VCELVAGTYTRRNATTGELCLVERSPAHDRELLHRELRLRVVENLAESRQQR
jgi:hypothetical protein